MNRDDVIRMAREAGFVGMDGDHGALRRFAAIAHAAGAAAEREACEQACWDAETNDWEGRKACIDAIRARGNT